MRIGLFPWVRVPPRRYTSPYASLLHNLGKRIYDRTCRTAPQSSWKWFVTQVRWIKLVREWYIQKQDGMSFFFMKRPERTLHQYATDNGRLFGTKTPEHIDSKTRKYIPGNVWHRRSSGEPKNSERSHISSDG